MKNKLKSFLLKFKFIQILIKFKIYFYSQLNQVKMKYNKLIGNQEIPDILNNINIEISSKCNLGCKFCGYTKRNLNDHPHTIMSDIDFENNIKECEVLGYENIGLSPVSGDIFMDKHINNKFEILENSNIKGYYFFTNFIPIQKSSIDKLFLFKKLNFIGISIYGHDLESFEKVTDSNKVSYYRLVENLQYLYQNLLKVNNNFVISLDQRDRIDFNLDQDNSELSQIIKKILKLEYHNISYEFETNYNNWGGLIKDEDIKDLNIRLNKPNHKKVGSCSLLYSRLIIGANNTVNACACRDANYSLRIGNTKTESLKSILSIKNKKYLEIIDNHEKEKYPSICKDCDFYTSIYSSKHAMGLGAESKNKIKLKDFYNILSSR